MDGEEPMMSDIVNGAGFDDGGAAWDRTAAACQEEEARSDFGVRSEIGLTCSSAA